MRTVPLGEVSRFVRGLTFKPTDIEPASEINVDCFRTKNVQLTLDQSDVWSVPSRFVKRPEQLLREGDLLISSANSWNLVGRCSWIPSLVRPTTFGGFVTALRGDRDKADARYLYHWFSSDRTQLTVRSFGNQTTNISNLDLKRTASLRVPLPPLDEQLWIAAILDKADELRAKRRETLAHLDALTQSIFHDMFSARIVTTVALGTVLDFVTSGGRGWAKYYADHGSQFIRSLDVQKNRIGSDQSVFVDAPDNAESLRTRVQENDVLLTITGSLIGRAAPVLIDHSGAYISQHVAILRPKPSIQPIFLSHYLNSGSYGQRFIKSAQYGQTKPGLNFEQIRRFPIPHPSRRSQQQFATRVAAVERLKDHHRAQLAELDSLFASLQHRAFKGEL